MGFWLSLLVPLLCALMLWFDFDHANDLADQRAGLTADAIGRQLGERLDRLDHDLHDIAEQAQAQAAGIPPADHPQVPHDSPLQDVVLLPPGTGTQGQDLQGRPVQAPWLPRESAGPGADRLVIGTPLRAGPHARWMVPVAWYGDPVRRIGALLDADWFAEVLHDAGLGQAGLASIVHTQGILLARSQDNQANVGALMGGEHPHAGALPARTSGHFSVSGSHLRQRVAFRHLPHSPLIVMVSATGEAVFAAWWPFALGTFGAALLLSALWLRLTHAYARNAAEQQRLLEALQVQQTRTDEARRIARMGDWSWQVDAGNVWWSPEMFAIWGLPVQDGPLRIEQIPGLIHPDDRERFVGYVKRATSGGLVNETQFRILRPSDGAERTIYARSEWGDQTPGRRILRGIQQDITELAGMRTRLEQAERQYRYVFEHNPQPMWVYERTALRFLAVNDAMLASYGYSREELLAGTVMDIRPREERDALRITSRDGPGARAQGSVWTHLRKDGSVLRAQVFARPITFEDTPAWLVVAVDVTERERHEQRFQLIARATSDAIWDWDTHTGVTWRSESYAALFGYPQDAIAADQAGWAALVHPDDLARVQASIQGSLASRGEQWEEQYRFRRHDGSHALVLDRCVFLRDAHGKALRAVGGMLDITRRSQDEQDLRVLRRAVEATDSGVVIADARKPGMPVVYANRAIQRITGQATSALLGANLRLPVGNSPHEANELLRALHEHRETRVLLHDHRQDGQPFWNDVYLAPVRDDAGVLTHVVSIQTDVSERQRAQEQLAFSATHDDLTGLPNRHLLVDRLQQALLNADRHRRSIVVVFIDLDDFKLINDSLGHSAGDVALRAVARRLEQVLATEDTLARFGGDEFVAMLTERTDDTGVAQTVAAIQAALAPPFEIAGAAHYLGASIGWCRSPDAGNAAEDLLMRADLAMYQAKQRGRNRVVAYEHRFDTQVSARLRMVSELRLALERGEFELVFQPLFDMTGKASALEALLRWHHPERGLLLPGHFIGVCEESGLIVPLGRWVLGEAARHHGLLAAAGLGTLRIAVNVSALQFRQDLFGDVQAALREHAVPRGALELELTESVIMDNPEAAIDAMRRIDALGVSLSVDDFGTGYSSLSYLKRLPIDRLKIDRGFVRDLGQNADDAAICTSIIRLAQSLGLHTVAEGVETHAQLDWLRARGCEEVQGFLLGHPQPFAQVLVELARQRTITA